MLTRQLLMQKHATTCMALIPFAQIEAPNGRKIVQEQCSLTASRDGCFMCTEQIKIRPQRRTQKTHAINHDRFIIQYMHIRIPCGLVHGLQRMRNVALAIKLMIAWYINHRRIGKALGRPLHTLRTIVNIPGQHHHIGLYRLQVIPIGTEFQMQIRKNV